MDDLDLLSQNGLSILRLHAGDWDELEESRSRGKRFSWTFRHAVARAAKRKSLALIAIYDDSDERYTLRMALVRSITAVTTFDSRVVFDFVSEIHPYSLSVLLEQVTEKTLQTGVKRFSSSNAEFEHVSEKLGRAMIELIVKEEENHHALQQIIWQLKIPTRNRDARALQVDAVKLALKAFGATDEAAAELDLPGPDTALAGVRLQEDAVIEHDARWVDGWTLTGSEPTGRAIFQRQVQYGTETLEIFTANKLPLEELFGVDLIYFNRARGSIVMVQYKMMELDKPRWKLEEHEELEWLVRIDDQFKEELARMEKFDVDLDESGPYRLNPSAFFFKLVKRNSEIKSSSLILSLGHLNHLTETGALTGPKGGLRISYRDLNGHYIRASGLVELIRSGYIGTRGATTDHLEQLINATLSGGRGVVAAIQTVLSSSEADEDIEFDDADEY